MDQTAKTTMGTMISSLRKQHGMTQAELAEQMGVTDKAVSKWERDLSYPDVSSLPRLAEVFGVSVDELMQGGAPAGGEAIREKSAAGGVIDLIFKALALAMGVGVAVLSILHKLDPETGFTLLGLGLACAGVNLLRGSS